MADTHLSATELLKRLSDGSLVEHLSITAIIKLASDSDAKSVLIAPQDDCSNWISLPLGSIGTAEYIGSAPCLTPEPHSHPIVRITLSGVDDNMAKLLQMAFAERTPQTVRAFRTSIASAGGGTPRPGLGARAPIRQFRRPGMEAQPAGFSCSYPYYHCINTFECGSGCACVDPFSWEGYCSYCCMV